MGLDQDLSEIMSLYSPIMSVYTDSDVFNGIIRLCTAMMSFLSCVSL